TARVYYEDTDAGGVVYYANYLRYAERGRSEFLRVLGIENSVLAAEKGILFVVRRVEGDYHKPARLDDLLVIETTVSGVKNASFTMEQVMRRDDAIIFRLHVVVVCVNQA